MGENRHLVEAKFRMRIPGNMLFRKRVAEKMDECFMGSPVLMLNGAGGTGKTVAAYQYAQSYYPEQYYYLRFDADDNQPDHFCKYLEELMCRAGILHVESGSERNLADLMEDILCGLQSCGHGKLFILDQMQELVNPSISDAFARFFSYLPDKSRFILISRGGIQDALWEYLMKLEISSLPVEYLKMNNDEIRALFGTRRITVRQSGEIMTQTECWCGAVHAVYLYFKDTDHIDEIHEWNNPYLMQYISITLWNTMDDITKALFVKGRFFPYLTEGFCREILGVNVDSQLLDRLRTSGLLHYHMRRRSYSIPDFLKQYMAEVYADEETDGIDIQRAAEWYVQAGDIAEAFRLLYGMGRTHLLREYFIKYGSKVARLLGQNELEAMVKAADRQSQEPMMLYLQGLLFLWKGDRTNFKEIIRCIREYSRTAEENRLQWAEVYLNLLYEDPDCSIVDWLEIGERLTRETGPVNLYSVSNGHPGICFGVKELSELFIHNKKTSQIYAEKWKLILGDSGSRLLEIAQMEYMLESDGERRIIQKLNESIAQAIRGDASLDELLGYAGIIFKLTRNGHHREDYQEVLREITSAVYRHGNEIAIENLTAANVVIAGMNGDKEQLLQWLKYGIPAAYDLVTRENAYVNMMRARSLMLMMQYGPAQTVFEKTAAFYHTSNQTLMCARCLFGQAAALYELGEKSEAMKISARAITLGTKYRYTSIYTEYGKTGVTLIEEYQKMTGVVQENPYSRKKKYYYGNVLTASYEGYHSILLRNAKKEMRYVGDLAEKDQMRATLTMTEMLILQYINSGYSNRQIGEMMNIQLTTVKTHVYSIYKKLDVSSRVMAINKAKELKII